MCNVVTRNPFFAIPRSTQKATIAYNSNNVHLMAWFTLSAKISYIRKKDLFCCVGHTSARILRLLPSIFARPSEYWPRKIASHAAVEMYPEAHAARRDRNRKTNAISSNP